MLKLDPTERVAFHMGGIVYSLGIGLLFFIYLILKAKGVL